MKAEHITVEIVMVCDRCRATLYDALADTWPPSMPLEIESIAQAHQCPKA